MSDSTYDLEAAWQHCSYNRQELAESEQCGCFYCLRIYDPTEITWWANIDTAICPYCTVDSVIGSASGYPITENFLRQMQYRWFESTRVSPTERD